MVRSIYPESQNSQFGMTSEMSQKSKTDTSTVDVSVISQQHKTEWFVHESSKTTNVAIDVARNDFSTTAIKTGQVADKQRNTRLELSVDKREGGHIGFTTWGCPGSSSHLRIRS